MPAACARGPAVDSRALRASADRRLRAAAEAAADDAAHACGRRDVWRRRTAVYSGEEERAAARAAAEALRREGLWGRRDQGGGAYAALVRAHASARVLYTD